MPQYNLQPKGAHSFENSVHGLECSGSFFVQFRVGSLGLGGSSNQMVFLQLMWLNGMLHPRPPKKSGAGRFAGIPVTYSADFAAYLAFYHLQSALSRLNMGYMGILL